MGVPGRRRDGQEQNATGGDRQQSAPPAGGRDRSDRRRLQHELVRCDQSVQRAGGRPGLPARSHASNRAVHIGAGRARPAPDRSGRHEIGRRHIYPLSGHDLGIDPLHYHRGRRHIVLGDQHRQGRAIGRNAGEYRTGITQVDFDHDGVVGAPIQPDLEQVRHRDVEHPLAFGARSQDLDSPATVAQYRCGCP